MAALLLAAYRSEGDPVGVFGPKVSDCDWDPLRAWDQASDCDWDLPKVFDQVSGCDSSVSFFQTTLCAFGVEFLRVCRHCQDSALGPPEASR